MTRFRREPYHLSRTLGGWSPRGRPLSWNERMPSVRLEVDHDRARALGLAPAEISRSLQTLISGVTATTVREETEDIAVVARDAGRAPRPEPHRRADDHRDEWRGGT